MKLFTRYNRINLPATVTVFLIASLVFYFFLRRTLYRQIDEDLGIEQTEVERYLSRNHRLLEFEPQADQQIFYQPATNPVDHERHFKTIAGKAGEDELRQLSFNVQLSDKWYTVTVRKSLEGTDNLTHTVALMVLVMVMLILIISLLINRLLLQRLWRPFYDTISTIKQFRLDSNEPLHFSPSVTDEFALLNTTLQQTTEKAGHDFQLLKEFTENASHELQTPLAVIRSKLDLLMQHPLDELQSRAVQSAAEALQGLVQLNKSLLLLTKIQNNQYREKDLVNLKRLIEEKLIAFEELVKAKELIIHPMLEKAELSMNGDLANMLVSNLLGNAIRHNKTDGTIRIGLTAKTLIIENTGDAVALDETRLFTRFYHPSGTAAGTGLGLSIVKQICQVSGFTISYRYAEGLHRFTVDF